ncbi:MAG TPA: hypothetical protein VM533_21465 [Fimbriiglobus sp.]|jgi:hypothetical protein|nr:hypothetical protein [Fimbriiglobus sp.]
MTSRRVDFEDADAPGRVVAIDADPQTAVTPGDRPGTAIVISPDGRQVRVVGDYRDVHVKIQAAAAAAHEAGPEIG